MLHYTIDPTKSHTTAHDLYEEIDFCQYDLQLNHLSNVYFGDVDL